MDESWMEDRESFRALLKTLNVGRRSDSQTTERQCAELRQIALAKNRPVEAAVVSTIQADALCELGRLAEAYNLMSAALPTVREDNDPEFLARALCGLALIQNEMGDRGSAIQSLIESINLAKEFELREIERTDHLNIGFIQYLENCPEDAMTHFQKVVVEGPQDFVSGLATSNMASLLIDQGQLDEAELLINEGLKVQESLYIRGLLYGNLAMLLSHRKDDQAWSVAEQSVDCLLKSGRINYSPMPFHDIARVYHAQGLGDLAWKAINEAHRLSELVPTKPYADEIRYLRAKILILNRAYEEGSQLLLKHLEMMETKFANQTKLKLELAQQRWDTDWARKEADILRSVNRELAEARTTADRANESKSQFLANVSHEIRTPLHGVIGMSSLLLDMDLGETVRDHLHSIKSSGETLLTLINDLLDLSKIDASKISIHVREFRIEDTIDEVLATMQSKAFEKGVEFFAMVSTTVPRVVRGDPDRIKQIWINLIGNAIKFTSKGSVIIDISWEHTKGTEGTLTTKVIDSGIGIPLEAQDRIFDRFAQASTQTSSEYGGTGLGLTISRRLALSLGGYLTVQSEVGLGSTFECQLPLDSVEDPPQVAVELKKALIVGDSPLASRSLALMLVRNGIEAEMVDDGKDFDLLHHSKTIVFLSENRWAHLNLGLNDDRSYPPVIVTTSDSGYGGEEGTFLRKPFRFAHVRRALHSSGHESPQEWSTLKVTSDSLPREYGGKRFLVVEDNSVNQKILTTLLKRLGAEVDWAVNGEIALKVMLERSYDLIFMDGQMPVLDGYECTRAVRQMEASSGQHRLIIGTTASGTIKDKEDCLRCGMDDYLAKPFTPKMLLTVIERAFESEFV